MSRKILLCEPNYKNRYPPLGLMKLATYYKQQGDNVKFYKGDLENLKKYYDYFDIVCITTLFTFYWDITIKTINFCKKLCKDNGKIFIGGIMASLLSNEIEQATGIKPVQGLLDKPKILDNNKIIIDNLLLDYSILDDIEYKYPVTDSYFSYMSRGCKRACNFCMVNKLEPNFVDYIPIKNKIKKINKLYGEKQNLMLLDNNVFLSNQFNKIVDEIKQVGFYKGACLNDKPRYVDFNQGLDARLIVKYPERVKKLSEINLHPFRISFDNWNLKNIFSKAVEIASKNGFKRIAVYLLFNSDMEGDTPINFYYRIQLCNKLYREYKNDLYIYPMRYHPFSNSEYLYNRNFIGKEWNLKYVEAIKGCIDLIHGATSGKSITNVFGNNETEFKELLLMPRPFIRYPNSFKNQKMEWSKKWNSLNDKQQERAKEIIFKNVFNKQVISQVKNSDIKEFLKYYLIKEYKK